MDILLIRGLRQIRVEGGLDWRELVTDAIRGNWPEPKASRRTQEAERGLGIDGKPYYFYVLRANENYGLVVFVLSEVEDADWPPDARGATPFDSGGLWWKKIVTNPELDDTGRQAFFRDHDVSLAAWRAAFEEYLHTRYGAVSNYLKGDAPEPGSEVPNPEVAIVKLPPNDERAWTWEVRLPHGLIAARLDLRAACMTGDDRGDYLDWLSCSALTDGESQRIGQWVEDHVIVPDQGVSATQAAEDWLMDHADA